MRMLVRDATGVQGVESGTTLIRSCVRYSCAVPGVIKRIGSRRGLRATIIKDLALPRRPPPLARVHERAHEWA